MGRSGGFAEAKQRFSKAEKRAKKKQRKKQRTSLL
jgi:hypothetical protein